MNDSSPDTPMEVHHHPQLEHKPKPWKEYLLEGLMIFLAVMLGFIAENIRENLANGEHARELTSQLIRDLKSDTAQLNKIYQIESQIANSNDSLITLLKRPLEKKDIGRLQQLAVRAHVMWPFHPSAGAIDAIKNQLQLTQFSRPGFITYISGYETDIDLLRIAQNIALEYQKNYTEPFLIHHFSASALDSAFNYAPGDNMVGRNLSTDELTEWGARMVLIRLNTLELLRFNRLSKAGAEQLLAYVKKEFNPADE